MIDPHVHLRDWGQSSKETVLHGMRTAARGGFTHLFDMPNTSPACTGRETVLERLALGGEASDETGVSYHLYGGITNDPGQVRSIISVWKELFPLVPGLKLFAGNSTGNMGIIGIDAQRQVFRILAEEGFDGVLAVHAEKEELLCPGRYVPGDFATHSDARPAAAETESVRDLISLADETGFRGTLHICHVSAASTIELIRSRKGDMRITMGVTPHHALLTRHDAEDHSRYLKMNPPLRDEADRKAVFAALMDGTADWVESDHAPHTREDKEKGALRILVAASDKAELASFGDGYIKVVTGVGPVLAAAAVAAAAAVHHPDVIVSTGTAGSMGTSSIPTGADGPLGPSSILFRYPAEESFDLCLAFVV